jgi:hypothetical protein
MQITETSVVGSSGLISNNKLRRMRVELTTPAKPSGI